MKYGGYKRRGQVLIDIDKDQAKKLIKKAKKANLTGVVNLFEKVIEAMNDISLRS